MRHIGWQAIACGLITLAAAVGQTSRDSCVVLRPQELLQQQTFWDNQDWDWYLQNIPWFDCPNPDLQTTYYYRWELITKHLTYGSPDAGYVFTEFIDRPFWSGRYGAISCPAGHQLYEVRWLRNPRYAHDYARYWFRTPGAQPRNYSTWLADAVWATHRVHPRPAEIAELLPDLLANYRGWEERQFVPDVGLFWQTGHDDGMEFNINSRQTTDILRGGPGYRPTLNSYLWADALAIARVADLAQQTAVAAEYREKAAALKRNLQAKLWDPQRQFFYHLFQHDEQAEGFTVQALTWTHQTGRFAGSPCGRELIGFVPWQFGLPDAGRGYEVGWKKLLEPTGFSAPFGPTTVERDDPMFALRPTCCWWSGQSWPYATSQTLQALAQLLQHYEQSVVTAADYCELLERFARTHRKEGRPYLAEACHPDTGSFAGHDGYNHSEHYFHSSFNDLVITGLVGVILTDDDTLQLKPLAPPSWPYFALEGLPYRGHLVSVVWDRDGSHYERGAGLRLWVDGQEVAARETLGPLQATLSSLPAPSPSELTPVNFAVNNDGTYYPRLTASFTNPQTTLAKACDGNYWYHRDPPNRWTAEGSPNSSDAVTIDFGIARPVHTLKLYFLDDERGVVAPQRYEVEYWTGQEWRAVPAQSRSPAVPTGHRANVVRFPPLQTERVRVTLDHAAAGQAGLTECEVWGDTTLPCAAPPHPPGNLAYRDAAGHGPQATASFSDRFGGQPLLAVDGITQFVPHPLNRWTCYESPNATDWLQLEWAQPVEFSRVDLAIYDDRGGVQPPQAIGLETWDGAAWRTVVDIVAEPPQPTGSHWNSFRFRPAKSSRLRVVFQHAGQARSGISEIMVWRE